MVQVIANVRVLYLLMRLSPVIVKLVERILTQGGYISAHVIYIDAHYHSACNNGYYEVYSSFSNGVFSGKYIEYSFSGDCGEVNDWPKYHKENCSVCNSSGVIYKCSTCSQSFTAQKSSHCSHGYSSQH